MASEQARELRKQGIAAAKAGQKEQARQLLQQSLRLDPGSEAAWLWLTTVARDQREKLVYLSKLLEINPNNEMALQSLTTLGLTRDELMQQVRGGAAQAAPPVHPAVRAPQPRAAEKPAPEAPGIPIPDPQRIAEAQNAVDALVREYLAPPQAYPGITWVHKSGKRAGERDALYLRLYVASGVAVVLVVLLVVGAVVVMNNPQLRGIVFAPTPTFSPTPVPPTMTYTPTSGFTPTPSPTPELTLTPSPTVPPEIPNAAVLAPQPTEIYPPIIDRSLRGAVGLLDSGLYDAALPTLEVEVTRVANAFDPNPYYYRALALARTGELDAAAGLLQAAARRLSERPNENFEPFINSGFAYVDLLRAKAAQKAGRRDEVQTLLRNVEDRAETVIERDPRLELAYLTLAERYSLERNYEEAIAVLDRGLSVPQLAANVKLIVAKGEAYFQQKEYDLAAYQAFLALYINPTTEAAHLLQIKTTMAQGKPGLAVLQSQGYLFYYPGSVEGYRLLGDARVAEGNLDLALEAYDQALAGGEDKPEVATILVARATLYLQQRRYERARDDLTKAFTLSGDPAIRALRMQAAYQAGNFSTAESDAEALLGQGVIPDSQIRLLQARILLDQARSGDTADSQQALTLLDGVSGDLPAELVPVADEYRARALYNLGNYDQGLDAINRALAAADTGSRHYLRGLILEANGETERARREYEWVLTWSTVYPYGFLPDVRARLEGLSDES